MATTTFSPPARAWLRPVSASYADCLRTGTTPIDVGRARAQWTGYRQALEALGVTVDLVPGADALPDACFVEDTAVLLNRCALLTRPGALARREEVTALRPLLAEAYEVHELADPAATLDGGDVLRAGATLFVGLSERTNAAGARGLAMVAARDGLGIVTVPLRDGLHLKSATTLLDPERALVFGDGIDPAPLRAAGLACVPVPEAAGANVLALVADVVVSAAAPRTADLLGGLGFRVVPVAVDELHKGDGALTCLSLRQALAGRWCI